MARAEAFARARDTAMKARKMVTWRRYAKERGVVRKEIVAVARRIETRVCAVAMQEKAGVRGSNAGVR